MSGCSGLITMPATRLDACSGFTCMMQLYLDYPGSNPPRVLVRYNLSSSTRPLFPIIRFAEHRLEALYWCVSCLLLGSCSKNLYRPARNHWSLYPTFFPGRDLPVSICDELIEILSHGCVGEFARLWLCFHEEPNVDTTDSMTSSSPTLPYDVDTMQKMIEVVKNAKGTSMYCTEVNHR